MAGKQSWRNLLFLHWPVPVDELRPLVPQELTLDPFDGQVWVGLVPFRMHAVHPSWLPEKLALDFLECNLRTYVVYKDRPGVYFFSLDASSRLAVWAARLGWSLPYFYAQMRESTADQKIRYQVKRTNRARLDLTYRVGDELPASKPGSPEFFFLERYLLFSKRRGQMRCGQVHHMPYPANSAEVLAIDDGLISAAGLSQPAGPPTYAHWSPGVDVEVFELKANPASSP